MTRINSSITFILTGDKASVKRHVLISSPMTLSPTLPVAADQRLLDALLALPYGGPPPPVDARGWRAVDVLADAQDLHGFLRAAVDRSGLAPQPELAAAWRRRDWEALGRGQLMRRAFLAALEVLGAAAIEVIPLKGAALCEFHFGDWSRRPLGDLDLLVPPADAQRAVRALAAAGYAMVLGRDELVERAAEPDLAALAAFHAQASFRAPPPGGVVVDLHWHLFDRPAYRHGQPMDAVWERSRAADVDGRPLRLLSPADMVLHLAGHRAVHHPEWPAGAGRWRHDLATWLRAHPDLDWAAMADEARRAWLLAPLREALAGLPPWAGLPPEAIALLMARSSSRAERRALAWSARPRAGQLHKALDQLLHLPGWRPRLRYAAARLWPSPHYMRRRYGRPEAGRAALVGLYLARLARLARPRRAGRRGPAEAVGGRDGDPGRLDRPGHRG